MTFVTLLLTSVAHALPMRARPQNPAQDPTQNPKEALKVLSRTSYGGDDGHPVSRISERVLALIHIRSFPSLVTFRAEKGDAELQRLMHLISLARELDREASIHATITLTEIERHAYEALAKSEAAERDTAFVVLATITENRQAVSLVDWLPMMVLDELETRGDAMTPVVREACVRILHNLESSTLRVIERRTRAARSVSDAACDPRASAAQAAPSPSPLKAR